jgi:hypothetical protein
LTEGNFHSVFSGQSAQTSEFASQSYKKIGKAYLYGSFRYTKDIDKGLNFTDTNDPEINYPYLLTDTIGNSNYNREFFKLKGIIALPVNSRLWGLRFDYQAGVASQNRDPRPDNKVMKIAVSPGLIFKYDYFRIGANLSYRYYNEDIDVIVVQENRMISMFQLHGLGSFGYHSSNSFARLYQANEFGGEMQFEWMTGNVSNLFYSGFNRSFQTIDDGRKGVGASWAATKNDSRLDGINWNLADLISIEEGDKEHQLKASLDLHSKLGTEFIQRLEKVGETDLEHWITYGNEQKYNSLKTNAELVYKLISKDGSDRMNSLLNAGVTYSAFRENYYLPDEDQRFSNLTIRASYMKLFEFALSNVSAEMRFSYRYNIEREHNLNDSFVIQRILVPENKYLTEDFLSPGISLGYQFPLKQIFDKCFVKTDFDWIHAAGGFNRVLLSINLGLNF